MIFFDLLDESLVLFLSYLGHLCLVKLYLVTLGLLFVFSRNYLIKQASPIPDTSAWNMLAEFGRRIERDMSRSLELTRTPTSTPQFILDPPV